MPTIINPSELPQFDADQTLVIDIESTTFDDKIEKVKQFNPFLGPRIAGVAVSTMDGKDTWYVPMRHRGEDVLSEDDDARNMELEPAQRWLQDMVGSGRNIVGHNVKFDAKFWFHDGAQHQGELIDTIALARLVDNSLNSYSLGALTGAKGDAVMAYMKSIKSKDWGRCPIHVMSKYAQQDARITAKLYHDLMAKLPEKSKGLWDVERRLTGHLCNAEIHGMRVDVKKLKQAHLKCIKEMIELEEAVHEIAGVEFDPMKESELNQVLIGRLGIDPPAYTPTGKPKWDKVTLMNCNHEIGPYLAKLQHLTYFTSTYCEGWGKRLDKNGRVHGKLNQGGTRTGRMSSSDPNLQNIPVEAEEFVLPDEGCVIIGWDYSQIEYRIFGHYANDQNILDKYNNDPMTDFHQSLADELGVDRQFAKALNFSFVYGMGKKKLLKMISALCAIKSEDEGMREKMRAFLGGGSKGVAQAATVLADEQFMEIAENIYAKYHKTFPSIRRLSRRVMDVVNMRGTLFNYCGRVYHIEPEKCYIGINYLIQGSAADLFKQRLLAIMEQLPQGRLITCVHDSMFFSVPEEDAEEYFREGTKILCAIEKPEWGIDLRVPIEVEGKVSASHWAAVVKVKDVGELQDALEKSRDGALRGWGEIDEVEVSHGHGLAVDFKKIKAPPKVRVSDGDLAGDRKANRKD